MEVEQLSIFDFQNDEVVPFQKGDKVRVTIQTSENEDPESYYYLKQFEKKKGLVKKVIHKPKLQYIVCFGDEDAYLYHEELTI